MSNSARAAIFARIRRGSSDASAADIAGQREALGRAPAADLPGSDLYSSFLANVLLNHGTVDVVGNRSEAVAAVGKYLYQHHRTHRLVAGHDPRLAAMPWRDAGVLPRFGELEAGEPAALSYARLAIAELGAVVTFTGKANPAANNLLPDNHIVIVDSSDLVTDMEAAWSHMNQGLTTEQRPRGINFIAGPSSTGDIAFKLVYGAHGPRHWHVILLGDVPSSALEEARSIASPADAGTAKDTDQA